jgi:hypothetical protein
MTPKIAETARQERAQGGRPEAPASCDAAVSAVGPQDKPEVANDAKGMLPRSGKVGEDEMAPGD